MRPREVVVMRTAPDPKSGYALGKQPAEQLPPMWELHANMRVAASEREQLAARVAMIEEWRRNARDLPTYTKVTQMPTIPRILAAGALLVGLALGAVVVLATLMLAALPWAS